MVSEGTKRQLAIVRPPKREQILPDQFIQSAQQKNLFPQPKRGLVIFVYFPGVTENEFRNTLVHAKPGYIFEFRSAPRFDIGSLDRRAAFQLFSEHQARYVDLACSSLRGGEKDCVFIEFKSFAKDHQLSLDRPIMLLMSATEFDDSLEFQIAEFISSLTTDTLEVFEVPRFSQV
jgi:hypothetical protein